MTKGTLRNLLHTVSAVECNATELAYEIVDALYGYKDLEYEDLMSAIDEINKANSDLMNLKRELEQQKDIV